MCASRTKCSMESAKSVDSRWLLPGTMKVWLAWVLAIVLLIGSGIVYRLVASHLDLVVKAPIALPVPLESVPTRIRNWTGTDLAIRTTTREYMERNFADDFVSRRYMDSSRHIWADVYVVYCSSRPGGILGHRPRVCYPAHGWIPDGTESSEFTSRAGRRVACLVHRFHKPAPMSDQIVVLNFYVLNGRITADEDDFSGPFSRRPNIGRDPARYVAQIQISSVLENSVRTAAEDMTDMIVSFLPDETGQVRATEVHAVTNDVLR